MHVNFDHAHVFASNLPATIDFFRSMLGGEIVWDEEAAGARTVRVAIGKGFVHVYDQAPRIEKPGNIHHLGVETDDLEALVAHMQRRGYEFRNPIRDYPTFRYVMVAAPDNVLIELFQVHNRNAWRFGQGT